jgi:hypothetical protein
MDVLMLMDEGMQTLTTSSQEKVVLGGLHNLAFGRLQGKAGHQMPTRCLVGSCGSEAARRG